jgi:hypothetical protein
LPSPFGAGAGAGGRGAMVSATHFRQVMPSGKSDASAVKGNITEIADRANSVFMLSLEIVGLKSKDKKISRSDKPYRESEIFTCK